jgi:hypothetical protein
VTDTDRPFTFEGCDSPTVCRDAVRPLLAPGMDWSEIQCGRCGKRGIVRHADLAPAAAPAPVSLPEPDPAPIERLPEAEVEAPAAIADSGRGRR